jgi:hypothetical protein
MCPRFCKIAICGLSKKILLAHHSKLPLPILQRSKENPHGYGTTNATQLIVNHVCKIGFKKCSSNSGTF